jgi:hypothetical protein
MPQCGPVVLADATIEDLLQLLTAVLGPPRRRPRRRICSDRRCCGHTVGIMHLQRLTRSGQPLCAAAAERMLPCLTLSHECFGCFGPGRLLEGLTPLESAAFPWRTPEVISERGRQKSGLTAVGTAASFSVPYLYGFSAQTRSGQSRKTRGAMRCFDSGPA